MATTSDVRARRRGLPIDFARLGIIKHHGIIVINSHDYGYGDGYGDGYSFVPGFGFGNSPGYDYSPGYGSEGYGDGYGDGYGNGNGEGYGYNFNFDYDNCQQYLFKANLG